MTTDAPGLREAAERLTQHNAATNDFDSPYYDVSSRRMNVSQLDRDTAKCAEAYLATHPSDGGEPISEEWLREIGWTRVQLRLEMGVDGRTIELYACVIADSPMRGLLVIFFKKNTKSIYNSLAVADNCIYHSSIAVNVTATKTQTRVIPQRGK